MNIALTQAVAEIERHVADAGWDQPVRLYALIDAAEFARAEPQLAQELGLEDAETAAGALTAIEQEELPADQSLDEFLSLITWPAQVAGCALVLERLVLPPEVEEELESGTVPEGDVAVWVAAHPQRRDVRIAVGVLRDGSCEVALRLRDDDHDDSVLSGSDLVPELTAALTATLTEEED